MSKTASAPAHQLETDWINQYAKTYLPAEAGFRFSPDHLREKGVNLVQLRHVLRSGRVVLSEKLEEPGAAWVVEGLDQDDRPLRVAINVVSEELRVTLVEVSMQPMKKESNDVA